MKKKLILIIALITALGIIPSFAQQDVSEIAKKLSISTQMFLNERNHPQQSHRTPAVRNGNLMTDKYAESLVAKADTIDGRVFISAFIRLDDSNNTAALETMGVQIQCRFKKGLVTALIPADKIEQVAALAQVKRINVSTRMRPLTNKAREACNVDDALLNTPDALRLGITNKYDGTGVVLGIIDTGIDFQHIAFKDKSGNSRIKRAYVYEGGGWWGGSSTAQEYTEITSTSPTTDDSYEDHGTHTSSTAGGSSVIIDGNNVTVTDDHAAATYGGMAPGADLYLAGINGLSSTYLANAFQKICNYADGVNKPVVVSNSWGSQIGPHDGTGEFADIMEQYFGDSHPGHICLFASSNDAGKANAADGGGYHISGMASANNPLGSLLRSSASGSNGGYMYYGTMANAWARTPGSNLACKIYVINTQTGAVLASRTVTSETTVSFSNYYSGDISVYFDYVDSNKSQVMLYAGGGWWSSGVTSKSSNGLYSLAVEFYPTNGECSIDVWGGDYGYFSNLNNLATPDHVWVNGSDNSTVSDECTDSNVIAIGAYSTKAHVTDYKGVSHDLGYTEGDIAYFSSYQEAGEGGTGEVLPHISAPGATVVSAVNHYDTSGDYSYLNGNSDQYGYYRVNTNRTSPYGSMEGTSMATPTAAGIVALWLQASLDENAAYKGLTVNQVKQIMRETAITDTFTTTGVNATHFGYGKIDALAGIQKILGVSGGPVIMVNPAKVDFDSVNVSQSKSVKIFVKGNKLTKPVVVSSSNPDFTFTPATLTADQAMAGDSITVTFKPSKAGEFVDSLTLTSDTLKAVVNLQGIAVSDLHVPVMLPVDSASITLTQFRADWTDENPASNVASYTLYVNKISNAVEVLHEDFSKVTTESSTAIANFDDFTDVSGWSGYKVFPGGNSALKLGATSYAGYLTTPELDLSKSSGKVTVKFNAKSYSGNDSRVYVSCGNDQKTVQLTADYADYVVVLNCNETDGQKVKFTCATRTKRVLLDNVIIYAGELGKSNQVAAEEGDSINRVITGITAKSYTVRNLAAGGTFQYTVKAIYTNGNESALSNQEEVTLFDQGTSVEGDVNMDGLVDVQDVTTLINKILGQEPSPFNGTAADLDKNGIYDVTDVTALINVILNK